MAAATTRHVWILGFPGAQSLDVSGPLEVFATASRVLALRRGLADAYACEVVAEQAGSFACHSGLRLGVDRTLAGARGPVDTLLVAGGPGVRAACERPAVTRWLARTSRRARRTASVCTGAFLLAEAGLLEGRRVTTHWSAAASLARRHPGLEVDADPIFVRDGRVATSAGVTAGMDLALSLVEEDHGRDVALEVARWLVMFLQRPGGQSQFSAQLASQLAEREPLREVQSFVADHPGAPCDVETLARLAGMSPRNFARAFKREVGTTPARYVERVRVESARRRLEEGDEGVEAVAVDCGFGSAETMRRAFLRNLRVNPADYRSRFRGGAAERETA